MNFLVACFVIQLLVCTINSLTLPNKIIPLDVDIKSYETPEEIFPDEKSFSYPNSNNLLEYWYSVNPENLRKTHFYKKRSYDIVINKEQTRLNQIPKAYTQHEKNNYLENSFPNCFSSLTNIIQQTNSNKESQKSVSEVSEKHYELTEIQNCKLPKDFYPENYKDPVLVDLNKDGSNIRYYELPEEFYPENDRDAILVVSNNRKILNSPKKYKHPRMFYSENDRDDIPLPQTRRMVSPTTVDKKKERNTANKQHPNDILSKKFQDIGVRQLNPNPNQDVKKFKLLEDFYPENDRDAVPISAVETKENNIDLSKYKLPEEFYPENDRDAVKII